MITNGLSQFNGKRILLLQGPIGPFFKRFSADLIAVGATVLKINFNGGDWLFYPNQAVNFNLAPEAWPAFFENFINEYNIDVVFLFGDCRPIHQVAHEIAKKHNIEIGVFEEGYIRPDYITLEKYGVNANSQIPKVANFYTELPDISKKNEFVIGKTFWFAAMWGMMYNAASVIASPFFRHYQHHRPLTIWQGLFWIRSLWRKWLYAIVQRDELHTLTKKHHKKYYLVPLQVHNDAQIHHHSDFFSIEAFISEVINSFAMHASTDCHLVIKHHPMDRGFNHYGSLIKLICQKKSLMNRVHYVHDLHLPTLLNHTKGVVVVNSTVGLSALDHLCPVFVCGNAIYDIEGLTYQGSLNTFWHNALSFKINQKLHYKFLNYLLHSTQINGNFYKRFKAYITSSGIDWRDA
ncbi:MAG TPA: capsular biosynthesis protein [Methylotenera sp.]|nr:capsular biosynthesis protein [Methylotenera sp.]